MTETTAAPALTWTELPELCPVCCVALPYPDDSQGHLSKRYRFGQLLWLIGKRWELAVDESCRKASYLAVAQRQRADALHARADTEYAARLRLVADYDKLDAERDALASQVAALRAALEGAREYLRHSEGCSYPFNELYGCRCGMLETLAETDAALAAAPEGV